MSARIKPVNENGIGRGPWHADFPWECGEDLLLSRSSVSTDCNCLQTRRDNAPPLSTSHSIAGQERSGTEDRDTQTETHAHTVKFQNTIYKREKQNSRRRRIRN